MLILLVVEDLDKMKKFRLGVVVHAYNPNTLETKAGRSLKVRSTSLAKMVKPHLYKNTKISQVWWNAPVLPDTREVEDGRIIGARRSRLQ